MGDIIEIDLSKEMCTRFPFPAGAAEKYLGGRGFNVGYLYEHLPAYINPLHQDNIMILTCGLLTGTPAPTSSRLHINALSPMTGFIGSSNVGGYIGARLRSCNIQSVIIRGMASRPVYVYIQNGEIEIRNAEFLWGLDTVETQQRLKDDTGDDRIHVLAIGPAGENQVPFACLLTDKDHAAGRTGMGAVMGSKNLKALAVGKGNHKSAAGISSETKAAVEKYVRLIKDSPSYKPFSEYGGAQHVKWTDDMGIISVRNFRESRFDKVDQIDGKRLNKYKVRSRGCYRCPVQCKAELQFKSGKYQGYKGHRPEFEPMINLGAKCGLEDIETIVYLDNLCSRLGLDTLSASGAIAFAMDLFDRGIITPEDTDGLDLSWGNGDAMETLIRQMAARQGFGAILSHGVKRAADIIGKGADAFAPHVKGLELTAYHPNAIFGTALGYAISSRGGDFVYACMEYRWSSEKAVKEFGTPSAVDLQAADGKGLLVKRAVVVNMVLDSLGLCRVPILSFVAAFDLKNEAALVAGVTGLPISVENLFHTGERIATMERLFNIRQGLVYTDDTLPPMFIKEKDEKLNPRMLERMVREYYGAMGWNDQGRPTTKKLKELGIAN